MPLMAVVLSQFIMGIFMIVTVHRFSLRLFWITGDSSGDRKQPFAFQSLASNSGYICNIEVHLNFQRCALQEVCHTAYLLSPVMCTNSSTVD